jgi:serine protease Do
MKKMLLIFVAAAVVLAAPMADAARKDASADVEIAKRLESAFTQVAEKVSPSVVVVTVTPKRGAGDAQDIDEFFREGPFRRFFEWHGIPMPRRIPRGVPREIEGKGSGTIIRRDGYIVTNHHVIDGADKIRVRLHDGREFDATLIGSDDRTDVAVIKIDAKNLPAAEFADSDSVRVGQWAIAIGAPFQLEYSFTVGFVSATGRSEVPRPGPATATYADFIQTDASINPGNSGGPLCDIDGRVIGLNTMILGLNTGIGFAIPSNRVGDIVGQLIEEGRVVYPWIGVTIRSLADDKEARDYIKDAIKEGVVVKEIRPDGPAANSDLKPFDIIIAVDGVKVRRAVDLQREVQRKPVGQKITLTVFRDGKEIKLAVQSTEQPTDLMRTAATRPAPPPDTEEALGITAQPLTEELAEKLKINVTEGVVVADVAPDSLAADVGIQRGDVITEIDRQPVKSLKDFKDAVAKANLERGILLNIVRETGASFIIIKRQPA